MTVGDAVGAEAGGLHRFLAGMDGDADGFEALRQRCGGGFSVGELERANAESLRKLCAAAQNERHAVVGGDGHEGRGESVERVVVEIFLTDEQTVGFPGQQTREIIEGIALDASALGDIDEFHQPT